MGAYAYLDIGEIQVGWAKNYPGDYGWLFLPSEKGKARYSYEDDRTRYKSVYKTKLGKVFQRLELAGYLLPGVAPIFFNRYGAPLPDEVCAEIYTRLRALTVKGVKRNGPGSGGRVVPEYSFSDEILNELCLKYECNFLSQLDEGTLLRILYENPQNRDIEVVWRYADVVAAGWSTPREIGAGIAVPCCEYLLITEGSSDSFVLQKAIGTLYPEVSGYFRFVDMKEGYPFTGTGSMLNFCKGLVKVGYNNPTLLLFDNDTEGRRTYNDVLKLDLPQNMKAVVLPDLKDAISFPTLGPSGTNFEDVNGKAVSIEMFLDFTYKRAGKGVPRVRWKSYDERMGTYQGALEDKEELVKKFKTANLAGGDYDTSKLEILLRFVYEQCVSLHVGAST